MKAVMDVPWLSHIQIEAAAQQLLMACFGTTTPPYPIEIDEIVYEHLYRRDDLKFSDEEDLGVDDEGSDILGKMLPRAGKVFVTSRLKREPNRGRYRFTGGHEIGHWELHRGHLLAILDQPSLFTGEPAVDEPVIAYRHSVFPLGPAASTGRREYQANRFAIALLVNPAALRIELEARFGGARLYHRLAPAELRRSSLRGFAMALASQSRIGLPSLSEAFEISKEAMAITLEEYGFVSEMEPLL
jgi:hypothetical protein